MDKMIVAAGAGCILTAFFIVFLDRIYIRRLISRMERMIDAAMEGSFRETVFDESLLSRLESRLAHYLRAGEVSMEKLSAEKDKIETMISDISHQTKNPIANLLLYTELLQEQDLSEEEEGYVNHLHAQAEKLKFLISSLVKLSRLENGILTLQPCRQKLGELLAKLEMEYRGKAVEKGLSFTVEKSDGEAVFDFKWTLEAVGNILDNAIKYTKTGGVTVKVQTYEMFACIQVADTGVGISEKEQASVFRRFYRSSQVHNEAGVGIGLYLAREIICGQGGYMKVNSKAGEGAVFSVYLDRNLRNCM